MKQCPACNRTYEDQQKFCSADGTLLVSVAQPIPAGMAQPVQAASGYSPSNSQEPIERVECQWCQSQNEKSAHTCRSCGAPLDIRNLVSESGWREAPRLKDMTEIRFGNSSCQVEGEIVPVAEITLGAGDSVFFEHHVLLWKDDSVPMSVMPLSGGAKRLFAGMPFIVSIAHGPGRVAVQSAFEHLEDNGRNIYSHSDATWQRW